MRLSSPTVPDGAGPNPSGDSGYPVLRAGMHRAAAQCSLLG